MASQQAKQKRLAQQPRSVLDALIKVEYAKQQVDAQVDQLRNQVTNLAAGESAHVRVLSAMMMTVQLAEWLTSLGVALAMEEINREERLDAK